MEPANCGPPLFPKNGLAYIIFSNGTIEGSSISFVCLTSDPKIAITVCHQTGDWEPHPIDICQGGMYYYMIL